MRNMLDCVDELIDECLRVAPIGHPPHYPHKVSALGLNSLPPALNGAELVRRILAQIEQNWLDSRRAGLLRIASGENWRWRKVPYIFPYNKNRETPLQKDIALAFDDDWVNQIPTLQAVTKLSDSEMS